MERSISTILFVVACVMCINIEVTHYDISQLGLSEWRELPAQKATVVGEDLFGRNGTLREVSHRVHSTSTGVYSCRRGFVWKEWYAEGSLAQSPLSELGLSEWRELPAQESTVVGEDLFGRNGTLREVSHGVHSTSTGVYSCRRGFVWKEWYAEGSLAQSPLSELGLSEWRELPAQESTVVGEDLFGRNGTLRELGLSEWRELPAQKSTVVGEDLFGRNGTLREVSHRVHSTSTGVYSCRRGFVWKEWYAEGSLAQSPLSELGLSEWRELPAQESTVEWYAEGTTSTGVYSCRRGFVWKEWYAEGSLAQSPLSELGLSEWRELPAQKSTVVRRGFVWKEWYAEGSLAQSPLSELGLSEWRSYQHRSLQRRGFVWKEWYAEGTTSTEVYSCRRGFVWKEWYAEGSLAQSPLSELGLSEWRELPAQKSTVVGEDLFGRNGTLREVSHGVHSTSTGVYSCRRGFVWKEWYAEGSLAQSPLSELGLSEWRELPAQESTVVGEDLFGRNGTLRELGLSEWRELPAQESTVVGEDLFGRNGTLREVSHRVHSTSTGVYSCRRGFVWKEWYAEGSLAQSPLSELGLSEWRELPAQESTVVGEDLFGRNGTLREVSHGVQTLTNPSK
ncbi:hypothetical protein J6590_093644 [Homalodisca vitripennis]|nr:hypothetical protein J6590_093644 [Homalodisca vitripennis]